MHTQEVRIAGNFDFSLQLKAASPTFRAVLGLFFVPSGSAAKSSVIISLRVLHRCCHISVRDILQKIISTFLHVVSLTSSGCYARKTLSIFSPAKEKKLRG